jgi:hypothetical protein
MTTPPPVTRLLRTIYHPLLRQLLSKKPTTPLLLVTFAPFGACAIPARTVIWAFFPKSRAWAELAPKPVRSNETVQVVFRKDLGPTRWSRRVATHHREEATGQKFVPKGEFLTSPQPGQPGFWAHFDPPFSTNRNELA